MRVTPRSSLRAVLALTFLPLAALSACMSQNIEAPPAPTDAAPAPTATTAAALPSAPRLLAKGEGVRLTDAGAERALVDGESADLATGSRVALADGGRAEMAWGEQLSGELLGGAVVEIADLGEDGMAVAQEAGTVHYSLSSPGAALSVKAGALALSASGDAGFVASLPATGGDAQTWVAVRAGSLTVQGPAPVASAAQTTGASNSLSLEAGQAAAFDTEGRLVGQAPLAEGALLAWLADLGAGKAVGPMAAVAPAAPQAAQVAAPAAPAPVGAPAAEKAVAPVGASFAADAMVVDAGGCTVLRWSAPTALFVTLDGNDVPNTGSQEVCLAEPRNYRLSWVGKDGKEESSNIGLALRAAATGGDTDQDDDEERVVAAPQPEPEPTECVGEECEVIIEPGVSDPAIGDPASAEPAPAEPAPAEPAPEEPAPSEPEPEPTP